MKKQNLLLAFSAFSFAINAAIASAITPGPAFVHARTFAGGPISCINTNVNCDKDGSAICQVQVVTTKPGTLARPTLQQDLSLLMRPAVAQFLRTESVFFNRAH